MVLLVQISLKSFLLENKPYVLISENIIHTLILLYFYFCFLCETIFFHIVSYVLIFTDLFESADIKKTKTYDYFVYKQKRNSKREEQL